MKHFLIINPHTIDFVQDLTISPLKARKDPPPSDKDIEDRRKLAAVAGQKQDNGEIGFRKEQDNARKEKKKS